MKEGYQHHWQEKFISRAWGRYPPEDLVRLACRTFPVEKRPQTKILEIGCGTGANIWFLARENFSVAGIDYSEAGIELARKRVLDEVSAQALERTDLRCGDFIKLPWDRAEFDMVIDIFALYANPISTIKQTLQEVNRVLKDGALFYSKLWGTATTGFDSGLELETGTFDKISSGPCADMGISHFFTLQEIRNVFSLFTEVAIDTVHRTDNSRQWKIEEFHCLFRKKAQ